MERDIFTLVVEEHYFCGDDKKKYFKSQCQKSFKRWWGQQQLDQAKNFDRPPEPGEDFSSSASASRKRSCLSDMGLRVDVRHMVDIGEGSHIARACRSYARPGTLTC